jgi:ABC-2 type transport system permease protein
MAAPAASRPLPTHPTGLRAASFAIAPAHVRTLLWLRFKLTLRRYTRSWQQVVGLFFGLLFLIPVAGGLAVVTGLAYTGLSHAAGVQVLFAVVAFLYIIWALLPLLQYSLNEGLDVTKLQIYPLTRGEQMVSLVLATFLDLGTLFILALYVAIFIGWHASPAAAAVTLVALVLAYVHTVGFSQLMLAALMGLLRSRRFRDLTVIMFAVLGSICSLSGQLFPRIFVVGARGVPQDPSVTLASAHLDQYLRWTPPGMAAQAIVDADRGDLAAALPWLLASFALVPLLLYLWAVFLDRGITNAETAGAPRARRRGAALVPAGGTTPAARQIVAPVANVRRVRLISPVALAIARKDLRYLWRDPQLKAALISVIIAGFVVIAPSVLGTGYSGTYATSGIGHGSVLLAPLTALIVVLSFGLNALGMDRQGLQTLFLFPVKPLDILWGKNLFVGSLAGVLALALTLVTAALTGGWANVPLALAVAAAAILTMLGCGNVTSVLFPFRWRQMRMGETSTVATENGCLRSIISMLALAVTGIILIPVAAALFVPLAMSHREWLVFTLPAAILYGAAFHQAASRLIAPVLLRRAPEILAVTVRDA